MKDSDKIPQFINRAFFVLTVLFLLSGLLKTLFAPDEVNGYENRYAYKMASPTVSSYVSKDFQDSAENALSDQIFFSSTAKKLYNYYDAFTAKPLIYAVGRSEDRFIYYEDKVFLGENMLFYLRDLSDCTDAYDKKADNLNAAFKKEAQTDFFAFYIEKETDVNLLTGEKPGHSEYIRTKLELPDDRFAVFGIDSFAQFKEYFYKTDHHWNYKGAYEGYTRLAHMLDLAPMEPVGEKSFSASFSGSKSSGLSKAFSESLSAYEFDFPAMDISVNGIAAADYGSLWSSFDSDIYGYVNYSMLYGSDEGLVTFDTHSGGENVLIIGESFDNAIVKLLASHFNRTYSVDLRYYSHYMGSDFKLSDFIDEHDIDKVLLIGNLDFFLSEDFLLETD